MSYRYFFACPYCDGDMGEVCFTGLNQPGFAENHLSCNQCGKYCSFKIELQGQAVCPQCEVISEVTLTKECEMLLTVLTHKECAQLINKNRLEEKNNG